MAQLGKDSFSAGEKPMRIADAVELLLARIPCVEGVESVSLFEAEGRVLAEPLAAPLDLPRFDNSAVDGYAVRFSDLTPGGETILRIADRVAAGHAPAPAPQDAAAVRIFTGASMPEGLDTIFMQEDCRLIEDGSVALPSGLSLGANRRLRGEDIRAGDEALPMGRRLTPEDIGLAAALGVARLGVRRRLRAAIFSTGDEVLSPGEPLRPAAIYDANRFMLQALLRRLDVEVADLGVLADDAELISAALHEAAATHDLVLTSGGVSVGEEDHVKKAIGANDSLAFWRLAIKPGRPVAMGVIGGTPFVGLPGNPVAVFVTFVHVVRPLIAALSGAAFEPARALPVAAGFNYKKKKGRREFVRVSLRSDTAGDLVAEKFPIEGAAVLTSLTRTHGFVELTEDVERVAPGDMVAFVDYALLR